MREINTYIRTDKCVGFDHQRTDCVGFDSRGLPVIGPHHDSQHRNDVACLIEGEVETTSILTQYRHSGFSVSCQLCIHSACIQHDQAKRAIDQVKPAELISKSISTSPASGNGKPEQKLLLSGSVVQLVALPVTTITTNWLQP